MIEFQFFFISKNEKLTSKPIMQIKAANDMISVTEKNLKMILDFDIWNSFCLKKFGIVHYQKSVIILKMSLYHWNGDVEHDFLVGILL